MTSDMTIDDNDNRIVAHWDVETDLSAIISAATLVLLVFSEGKLRVYQFHGIVPHFYSILCGVSLRLVPAKHRFYGNGNCVVICVHLCHFPIYYFWIMSRLSVNTLVLVHIGLKRGPTYMGTYYKAH